jgi:hypothetical protein
VSAIKGDAKRDAKCDTENNAYQGIIAGVDNNAIRYAQCQGRGYAEANAKQSCNYTGDQATQGNCPGRIKQEPPNVRAERDERVDCIMRVEIRSKNENDNANDQRWGIRGEKEQRSQSQHHDKTLRKVQRLKVMLEAYRLKKTAL